MVEAKSRALLITMERETGRSDVNTYLGYVEKALAEREAETHSAVQALERIEKVLLQNEAMGMTDALALHKIAEIVEGYFGE